MFGDLKALFAAIAGGAIVFAVMLLFYEGIPLGPARDVPIFGTVASALFDGRVDRQRRAGAAAERIKWEDIRRRQIAANEAALREAQQKVDRWMQWLLERSAALRSANAKNAALERALAEAERETEDANRKALAAGVVCPPAMPRSLSIELDKMGR